MIGGVGIVGTGTGSGTVVAGPSTTGTVGSVGSMGRPWAGLAVLVNSTGVRLDWPSTWPWNGSRRAQ